ncbi:hypothetical protein [Roseovarius indicus]|uniref:Uncharacterized protein n=1 Tax=Roseovarius indicus TaxID=540747 RepID=A0A0T5P907_9RHOB|nr:hypothetical protein [Roseovarius indicus]KRS17858.1 hypothetical protein XM52_09820 [Roseovarius indicus]QEW27343.1 hypothetical protein RIdsm_03155 [Roseovarius indicus]SFD50011.1 hypothetical protein SAMN04488031_101191 [Roseovarius indicus]
MARILPAILMAGLLPTPALTQTLLNGDHSIAGDLCVGGRCTDNESLPTGPLHLKQDMLSIRAYDTSDLIGFASNDWVLRFNESGQGGQSFFAVHDETAGLTPFRVDAGAPENALRVDATGNIGIGTGLPLVNLHIYDSDGAGILMEDNAWQWFVTGTQDAFVLFEPQSPAIPFQIRSGAPDASIHVAANGNVGLGTHAPGAPLEVVNNSTFSYFRLTARQAAVNRSVDVTFTGGPLGTGELRYNIVDGDGPEMKLNANGDMEIGGTLITGGPTCASGRDAVFNAAFERHSVTDHAALMWENGHLPAVGPTLQGQPMNVSEKMGAMLNELEHAHIYIEELHGENAALSAEVAAERALNAAQADQIAALSARLDALEGN